MKNMDTQTNISSDLSACFKYLANDNQSILSDNYDFKKLPAEKFLPKSQNSNLQPTPLQKHSKPPLDSHTKETRICGENPISEDTDTPMSLFSNTTLLAEGKDTSSGQFLQKFNFKFCERLQLTQSISIGKSEKVDSGLSQTPNEKISYAIKRINPDLAISAKSGGQKPFLDKTLSRNLKLFRRGIYKYRSKNKGQQNDEELKSGFGIFQQEKGCSCKGSQCLKLYCGCFKSQGFCNLGCRCSDCKNRSQEDPAKRLAVERNFGRLAKSSGLIVGAMREGGLGREVEIEVGKVGRNDQKCLQYDKEGFIDGNELRTDKN